MSLCLIALAPVGTQAQLRGLGGVGGAGNIGGGGFTVIRLANGSNITIDYREKAPATAYRDMYLDSQGNAQMH